MQWLRAARGLHTQGWGSPFRTTIRHKPEVRHEDKPPLNSSVTCSAVRAGKVYILPLPQGCLST